MNKDKLQIGFIGQGWIGKNYADDFEERGFKTVRYALEAPYDKNKGAIQDCDIVFIAVPTPTTPEGFDDSVIRDVLKLMGKGNIAVIKSTMLPGTTESIQKENPDILVMHSPEFLTESSAAHDAAHPKRNIIGIPVEDDEYREKAALVLSVLPNAPYVAVVSATEAEIIKYARNVVGYARVLFSNILYDIAEHSGASWAPIKAAISADPEFGPQYLEPVHHSGRGAGGHCFIKDFAALRHHLEEYLPQEEEAIAALKQMEKLNKKLLCKSKKDINLLQGVYGDDICEI